jgi:putative transcriptional regulator
LVQFRTACDLCRRCKRALPPLIPLIIHTVEPVSAHPHGAGIAAAAGVVSDSDSRQPLPLGRTVERLRKAHGCSQEDLARLVGIRRTYLSRVENGHVMPGPRIVSKIAQALGIEMDELLVRESPGKSNGALRTEPNSARLVRMFTELEPREMAAIVAAARQMVGEHLQRSA